MGRARQKKKAARSTMEPLHRSSPQAPGTERTTIESSHFIAICIGLTIAVIVAYSPVRLNDFVYYDDPKYVTENPIVQGGLTAAGISWALRTGTDANWFPLTWLSHMLDVQIYGVHPAGHHVTNVVLHIANTLLLFFA